MGVGRLLVVKGISGPTESPGRRAWWACGGDMAEDGSILSKERLGRKGLGAAASAPG